MKKKNIKFLIAASYFLFFSVNLQAQTIFIWTGEAADDNYLNHLNWRLENGTVAVNAPGVNSSDIVVIDGNRDETLQVVGPATVIISLQFDYTVTTLYLGLLEPSLSISPASSETSTFTITATLDFFDFRSTDGVNVGTRGGLILKDGANVFEGVVLSIHNFGLSVDEGGYATTMDNNGVQDQGIRSKLLFRNSTANLFLGGGGFVNMHHIAIQNRSSGSGSTLLSVELTGDVIANYMNIGADNDGNTTINRSRLRLGAHRLELRGNTSDRPSVINSTDDSTGPLFFGHRIGGGTAEGPLGVIEAGTGTVAFVGDASYSIASRQNHDNEHPVRYYNLEISGFGTKSFTTVQGEPNPVKNNLVLNGGEFAVDGSATFNQFDVSGSLIVSEHTTLTEVQPLQRLRILNGSISINAELNCEISALRMVGTGTIVTNNTTAEFRQLEVGQHDGIVSLRGNGTLIINDKITVLAGGFLQGGPFSNDINRIEFRGTGTVFELFEQAFEQRNLTLHFDGSSVQMLPSFGVLTYVEVGESGVALSGDTRIEESLQMDGKIWLTDHTLHIPQGASLVTSQPEAYVVTNGGGFLNRFVDDSDIVFPVGTETQAAPVIIRNSRFPRDISLRVKPYLDYDPILPDKIVNLQWDVVEDVPGSSLATMQFQWNSEQEAISFDRLEPVFIGQWTGSIWEQQEAEISGTDPFVATVTDIEFLTSYAIGNDGAFSSITGFDVYPIIVSSSDDTVVSDQFFDVFVTLGDDENDFADLYGTGFKLNYDAELFELVSITETGHFGADPLIFTETTTPGLAAFSITKTESPGVSGFGTVASFEFKALTISGISAGDFWVTDYQAVSSTGEELHLTDYQATVTVFGAVVWPGDTNNDGIVDQTDVLPVGQYFELTGPARNPMSFMWEAQPATLWSTENATYADANGDGYISQNDILPIGLNFGFSTSMEKGSSISNDPYRILQLPPADKNEVFKITVNIGSSLSPVNDFMGFAGRVVVPANFISITNTEIGPIYQTTDLLEFKMEEEDMLSFAVSRKRADGPVNVEGNAYSLDLTVLETYTEPVEVFLQEAAYSTTTSIVTSPQVNLGITKIVSIEGTDTILPDKLELAQNFPNPFNPSTNIRYALPENGHVRLGVYNMLGQLVAELVNGEQAAGEYSVPFDATRLSSGIYLYQLESSGIKISRKMMLIK